jgi:hypothetical protein
MNLALAVEEGSRSYEDLDLEPEGSFPITVRNLRGLFVSILDSKIYLIHQTVKEFLVRNKLAAQPFKRAPCSEGIWKHSLEITESNLVLAMICITYLLFAEFRSYPLTVDDRDSRHEIETKVYQYTRRHGFLDYAAKHWTTHLLGAGSGEQLDDHCLFPVPSELYRSHDGIVFRARRNSGTPTTERGRRRRKL